MYLTDKVPETKTEWNTFDSRDRKSKVRTGAPTSLAKHDRGLFTLIGTINRDAAGQPINL